MNGDNDDDTVKAESLQRQVEQLKQEEMTIEGHTLRLQNVLRQMAEDDECKRQEYNNLIDIQLLCLCRLAYLSHVDIRTIPAYREDTLLAVKAPYGSTLEVPDPDEVCIIS